MRMTIRSAAVAALILCALPAHAQAPIDVCFRPGPVACDDMIVREILAAKTSVLVQAYSFTNKDIAAALVAAKKRRVDVRVIMDAGQRSEKYSSLDFLVHSGIPTGLAETPGGLQHNKVIIVDDRAVITGSYNFTKSAETRNAENLLIIRDAPTISKYRANWINQWSTSKPYAAR